MDIDFVNLFTVFAGAIVGNLIASYFWYKQFLGSSSKI